MIYFSSQRGMLILILIFLFFGKITAQFIDNFNGTALQLDPNGINGWCFFTGDGTAQLDFKQGNNIAIVTVDATKDKRGIWWALVKRCVSKDLNLNLLSNPKYELRIEARIRVSNAPKRVNLSLNTQRTTDFHSNLMEFDIPDTSNWYTISTTTNDFDAVPGDNVFGQLALMDWGLEKYRVEIDYFKVDVVNIETIGPDKGPQVPYRPAIADTRSFTNHIPVLQDAMIDIQYPDMKFNNWITCDETGNTNLLTVNSNQLVIMRWDLNEFKGKKVNGSGLLELTTNSLQHSPDYKQDFGMVRISEIIGGDPQWNQEDVTYEKFCRGQSLNHVINSQMIIDIDVKEERGSTNLITISNPVLQRLIDGKTLGLAIRPLGAVNASFYSMENLNGKLGAKLHLNFVQDTKK